MEHFSLLISQWYKYNIIISAEVISYGIINCSYSKLYIKHNLCHKAIDLFERSHDKRFEYLYAFKLPVIT